MHSGRTPIRQVRVCLNTLKAKERPLTTCDFRFFVALTHKLGKKWISPPECGSAQFDSEGKCIALTGGYVMDRRMGNTEGLGLKLRERRKRDKRGAEET